jgi:Tol biopolymer transport system component
VILAAVVGWVVTHPPSKSPSPPLKVVPLTSYPGSERSPTFSPDGSQFAFSWNGEKQDNFDIYVRLVDGGTPLRLTANPAADEFPAWSPDGRQIAFARAGAGIFLISPLGGPERKLADLDALFLAWSPDGKFLAAVERGYIGRGIFLFSIADGERRVLTPSLPTTWGDESFAFSPDGQTLAFARFRTQGSADLYLATVGGGEPRRITHNELGIFSIFGMAWTPGGRELVFSRGNLGGASLWRIQVGSSSAQPEPLTGLDADASFPAISRTAGRLAYERSVEDNNIWRMETAGPGRPGNRPVQIIASTRLDYSPQFSPDGKRIAFTSDRSGQSQVYVGDSDGSNVVQLTSLADARCNAVRWSPDGRRLAFGAMISGNRDIYVADAGGGATRRLTTDSSEEGRPSWSRDGRWIYFYSNRTGRQEVWKIPAEGGGISLQVTKGGGHESFESPDGKLLYYSKLDGPLWSVPVEAPGEEALFLAPARQGYWAVADKGIYFVDFEAAPSPSAPKPVKFFDFDTRQITAAGAIEGELNRGFPAFTVTHDGRWIAWAQIDRHDSDLMLVENFR